MEQPRDGYRRFLEVQVEAFQEQLYGLERDPEQVEYLKSILRIAQRLRHAREENEPEAVHLLRNAVEKVTLHLGRASVSVSQDVLDFYVDTFDLLEEAVRRWPGGPAFDRGRYADRVRGLLEDEAPAAVAGGEEPGGGFRGGEPVEVTLPEPLRAPGAAERDLAVTVLSERDLTEAERRGFLEVDLRQLLAEPWMGSARSRPEPVAAGGLAASWTTLEALRTAVAEPERRVADEAAAEATRSAEADAALTRLRDVLDAFSLSLTELDRAADRLLTHEAGALTGGTAETLIERLELEKQKLLGVFDRTIESFRRDAV